MLTTIHIKEIDPPDKHIGGHSGIIFSTNIESSDCGRLSYKSTERLLFCFFVESVRRRANMVWVAVIPDSWRYL